MMKHELEKQLDALEKKGVDRRHFFKLLAATGLIAGANTGKANAFSSSAKGKIVIIGGGAAGISMAARLKHWLDEPDITLIDPSDRQFYQPGFTLIASGVYQPEDVWKKQEDCMPSGIKWIKDSVAAVDPVWNQVTTKSNGKIPYDFLVLTPGLQCKRALPTTPWDKETQTLFTISKEPKRHGKLFKNSLKKEAKVFIPIPIQNINVVALPKRSVYYPSITQGNKGLATNCN